MQGSKRQAARLGGRCPRALYRRGPPAGGHEAVVRQAYPTGDGQEQPWTHGCVLVFGRLSR